MDDTASWCSDCRTMRTATNMRLARWQHRYGTTYPPLHPPARATQRLLNLLADPLTPIAPSQISEALDTPELAELLCIARLVDAGVLVPRRPRRVTATVQ